MQTINVKGYGQLNFPDSMSQTDIENAIHVGIASGKLTPLSDADNAPAPTPAPQPMTREQKIQQFSQLAGLNTTPLDTVRNIGAGMAKGAQNINQLLTQIPGAMKLAGFLQENIPGAKSVAQAAQAEGFDPSTSNLESTFGVTPENRMPLVQGMTEYFPYALAGGATIPGQIAAGVASGAANTQPGERNLFGFLPSGRAGGAIEGGLLNAITLGTGKALEGMRPSRLFRGTLTPEQLQRNVDVTQGTETGLGDVIGSPFLKKRLENTLTSIPFSGANEALQRNAVQVQTRGENILKDLLGDNSPENVPAQITADLKNVFKQRETEKNNLYTDFNNLADKSNLKLELPNFSRKANDYADAINNTNMLKFEPDSAKLFNKLQNYKNPVKVSQNVGAIVDANGNPLIDETHFEYPSAKEALLLKGKLNRLSNQAGMSPDPAQRGLSKVFKSLAGALGSDVQSSVNASKNPDLINALYKAEENYKKNFSQFLDKDIYKFVSGNADPETIVTKFIRTSPNADLAGHLTKLAKNISPQSRDRLAYSYFSRALDNEGKLNPSKLSTAIRKLGPNQLKSLVPDANMRQRLLDYTKFEQMNKEGSSLMYNPKTGQRAQDALVTGLVAMLGHAIGGDIGGLAAAGSTILGGRGMTRYLTSPTVRESLVRGMLNNRNYYLNPATQQALQTILQGNLTNAGSQ